MMKKLLPSPIDWTLLVLLVATLLLRHLPGAGEMYATHLYPTISSVLSWMASWLPFSLTEVAVVTGVCCLIGFPLYGLLSKQRRFGHAMRVSARVCVLYYIWFYLGWGLNYSRNSFYLRMAISPAKADTLQFRAFVDDYTLQLEQSWIDPDTLDRQAVIEEVRRLFGTVVPTEAALCQPHPWQNPKFELANRIYSGNGVLGFMGPFFCESHVNRLLSDTKYPFVMAHEFSHLMGVSSEAEANYWAYYICTRSEMPAVRMSGYYGVLPNVYNNMFSLLSGEEMQAWWFGLDPRIRWQMRYDQTFWELMRIDWLDEMQSHCYDLFLRGNGIASGVANYNQVVQMIISERNAKEESTIDY